MVEATSSWSHRPAMVLLAGALVLMIGLATGPSRASVAGQEPRTMPPPAVDLAAAAPAAVNPPAAPEGFIHQTLYPPDHGDRPGRRPRRQADRRGAASTWHRGGPTTSESPKPPRIRRPL